MIVVKFVDVSHDPESDSVVPTEEDQDVKARPSVMVVLKVGRLDLCCCFEFPNIHINKVARHIIIF